MRWIQYAVLALLVIGRGNAQTPAIFDGGVVNGASFQKGPITPGSLFTIFGSQLASRAAQADTIPLSASLGGVTVTFQSDSKTEQAPLLFVQSDNPSQQITSQINAQVPWDIIPANTTGTVNVTVTRDGVTSPPVAITVVPFSPAVFASAGRAIAVNPDGTLAWPSGLIPGLTTHPAKVGDVIIVYATGLGTLDAPIENGASSLDKLRNTLTKPIVTVGGITANVLFSGLSPQFVGVNQLNIMIPNALPGDSVPLQLQLGGTTSNSVSIAVSQ